MTPIDSERCVKHEVQLENMAGVMAEQKELLTSIHSELSRLSSYNVEVANDIKKAVFGNGSPGLVKELVVLKDRVEARKETHDKEICRLERAMCWMGGTLILSMISIIAFFLQQHFGK